jgi:YHYH protein
MFEPCTCTVDADYKLARYEETIAGANRTIRTMGIPNHPYHTDRATPNPNPVCIHKSVVSLPTQPVRKTGNTFTATSLGVTGILKTGGFLYNHLSNFQGVNDVAKIQEGESLDTCHGHADPTCSYHYHEISKLAACTHDNQWDQCEIIGCLLDGFPVYSHCFSTAKNRFLKSCFAITTDTDNDGGGDTTDYTHVPTNDCDLDMANGYDFTGKGIVDNTGKAITGYAYVASDSYPYVMAYYAGSTWTPIAEFETWPGDSAPVAAGTAPMSSPVASPMAVGAPVIATPSLRAPTTVPMAAPVSPTNTSTVCATTDACTGFLTRSGTRIHTTLFGRCVARCSTTFFTAFLLRAGWDCGVCQSV